MALAEEVSHLAVDGQPVRTTRATVRWVRCALDALTLVYLYVPGFCCLPGVPIPGTRAAPEHQCWYTTSLHFDCVLFAWQRMLASIESFQTLLNR
jgi:hypothetical protein